jgi:hypothetical protein
MGRNFKSKNKKVIISFIAVIFVLSNFYFLLFWQTKKAEATFPVFDPGQIGLQSLMYGGDKIERITNKIWEEIKAVFFKNVLGNLANLMAKQTAIWVSSGGQGESPQFITDLEGFVSGYADAAIGDFVQTVMQDLTGINVCTLDPSIAIDLAISIPSFPEWQGYQPDCSWTELRSHWEEIGQRNLEDFISADFGIGPGGQFQENTELMTTVLTQDQTLQIWDFKLNGYSIDCPVLNEGLSVICSVNSIQRALKETADDLKRNTQELENDVSKMLDYALSDEEAQLSQGIGSYRVVPENIPLIKEAWVNKINPQIEKIDQIQDVYNFCKNKTPAELANRPGRCEVVLNDLNVTPPPTSALVKPELGEQLERSFKDDYTTKVNYVINLTNSLKSGFEFLRTQVREKFNPDFFEGSAAYNVELAKDLFNPEANEFNAYETLSREIASRGLNATLNRHLQATVDNGWKSITDRIGDTIRTPSNILRKKAEKDIVEGKKTASYYTKNIAADALGVFLETLWNKLTQRLLQSLYSGEQETESYKKLKQTASELEGSGFEPAPILDIYNPFEQEVVTGEGARSQVERLAKQYQVNYSYKDVDLLSEFQLNLEGEVNPNIYNNVTDPNFALAINDELTISQALEQRKLIGDYKFSWGEEVEPGTYHLSNIKKLRKARVVPLGLELAAELIRDCNYRQEIGYDDFKDICDAGTECSRYGYNLFNAEPYKTQKLRNCLFKPYAGFGTEDLDEIKAYNQQKLNQVVNATLADVVNGFYKSGAGNCGDFDIDESPFCNLVDPNWVLKLPATKCALKTDLEPYNELLVTNSTGQRYSSCPDFASCLQEDDRGGCVNEDYGVCVKEENVWQFTADSCPEEFNSCRTYTLTDAQGTRSVSYLKNTLSGSDTCGDYNAGCTWYATKTVAGLWKDFSEFDNLTCADSGGTWLPGQGCASERIYLNRYAETCDRNQEGCNEFFLFRDPNNNLVTDSSFEYTQQGYFPQNWDLRIKELVPSELDCQALQGNYNTVCLDYNYTDRTECLNNNGSWESICDDGVSQTEADCLAAGANWIDVCQGAVNNDVNEADCLASDGNYQRTCIYSVLKYNLCENPQFTDEGGVSAEDKCLNHGGTWVEQCQIDGVIRNEPDLQSEENCLANDNASWSESCQGAVLYGSDDPVNNPENKMECDEFLGEWRGYGPFSDLVQVSKEGTNVYSGLGRLEIDISNLGDNEELQLVYTSSFNDKSKILTKGGDVYTATAYIAANQSLDQPIGFNLIKTYLGGDQEINSNEIYATEFYSQVDSTLITTNAGTQLDIWLNFPGGQTDAKVYVDGLDLSLNTIEQVRNYNFVTQYQDYELNNKVYYKKPPQRLNCHGYGPGDPAPILNISPLTQENCQANDGYWDEELVYRDSIDCYQYPPDADACDNFSKVCLAEEVGCQLYTPLAGGPDIPAVVSATDYCPAECVGYDTYKQETALYEPDPDPLYHYFIPDTATQCSYAEVGCSQFTNLDEVAQGGEGVEYFTYLRQCIRPDLDLGEKTYFSWQGSASGPPQLVRYEFQQDEQTGAPKTIDGEGDCRLTIGEDAFNCINFFDNQGNEYYRDIRKTISVSEDCRPYRKTESTEENCLATNGRWQSDINACLYDAIPSEGISCRAEANGCRAFIGNQGNNVYMQIFDNFEQGQLNWYSGLSEQGSGLTMVGESVQVGGHSLFVPSEFNSINKRIDIQPGNLYTLSFWAKSSSQSEDINIKFSTAVADEDQTTLEEFASIDNQITLTDEWQNYNLGPVLVSWSDVTDNRLVFTEIDTPIYLDNISLRVVRDNVYAVKNSWVTPDSCDKNIFGVADPNDPHPMLGCQAYDDSLGQRHNLKSFTNLCRESAVGCQILIDTQNSINPNQQNFNNDNMTYLDDYQVPGDELVTLVLNNDYVCAKDNKGCQRFGRPIFEGLQNTGFEDIYLKNNPDQYINVPQATMCSHQGLGCTELVNELGSPEYYKIEPTKLCQYGEKIVNNKNVKGWFKKGSQTLGCGSLAYETPEECEANGGGWSIDYEQCTAVLNYINDQESCVLRNGEWLASGQCLATPFTIYKVFEANKYKGYVGECNNRWDGCTEFIDINPNYIANGSFEFNPDNRLANWTTVAASSGNQQIETDDVKSGSKAVKLIKNTTKDCPSTYIYDNPDCLLDEDIVPSFGIKQKVAFLEKGKTYKASFYYKVPADAQGKGDECSLPGATIAINRYIDQTNTAPGLVYNYEAETDWKKAEILFTVPHGECSDSDFTTKLDCESVVDENNQPIYNWTEYEDLQNYEVILYAPRNENVITGEGNCPSSYILYDQIEIKDNTEDSYFVIDSGNDINRSACTNVDWNQGCVEFLNTFNNDNEILKVQKDRNCAEWAICAEKDSDGFCTEIDLCREEFAGECTKFSPKKDNVRYNLDSDPIVVKRISDYESKSGYIYRFGAGELTSLTQWRAGDYSGYTIPQRFPIEAELNQQFDRYPVVNDLGNRDDERYTEPICKIFPEERSPLPFQLSEKQEYKNILNTYSPSISPNNLGNMCNYYEVKAGGVTTYFPEAPESTELCSAPETLKGALPDDCEDKAEIETMTEVKGLEGMCLEFDTLNPVYDGIFNDLYGTDNYQPYACITFYPFLIDLEDYQ